MYYRSKEAEIYRILFDTCYDKIRPLLFLQSPLGLGQELKNVQKLHILLYITSNGFTL